jgi:TonB family protein
MKPYKFFFLFLLIQGQAFFCQAQITNSVKDTSVTLSSPDEDIMVATVDENAEFPGGRTALNSFFINNIVYPPTAIKDAVSGKVHIMFKVDKKGKVKDIRIVKGIREDLNEEALRVIKLMPVWKPAMYQGKPVSQKMMIPIKFELPAKK